jgi:hypothetical protein
VRRRRSSPRKFRTCWPRPRPSTSPEDAKFGKNRRGDELPEELRRREDRLAKIRDTKAALEAEAAEQAAERSRLRSAEGGDDPADDRCQG